MHIFGDFFVYMGLALGGGCKGTPCEDVFLFLHGVTHPSRSEGFPRTGIFSPCRGRGELEQDWEFFQPPPSPSSPPPSSSAPKGSENPKIVRNGSGKVLPGSRQVRMDQNCVPNPMECLPDPKTPIKNSKTPKIHRNPKNPSQPPIQLCWPYL